MGEPGTDIVVQWLPYDRGFGATLEPITDLFVVHLEGSQVPTPPMPDVHRNITPLDTTGATQVDIRLTQDSVTPLELGINGVAYKDAAPFMANVGETQVWTVTNALDFAHPFHLHGFFFQVLNSGGPLEWKDTISISAHATVKLAVQFDDRPGMWMFHCHILAQIHQ